MTFILARSCGRARVEQLLKRRLKFGSESSGIQLAVTNCADERAAQNRAKIGSF
jgi:hypothetical protein